MSRKAIFSEVSVTFVWSGKGAIPFQNRSVFLAAAKLFLRLQLSAKDVAALGKVDTDPLENLDQVDASISFDVLVAAFLRASAQCLQGLTAPVADLLL